ncbi:recombinase family protein [Thiomicrorhabdus sp.]|uniref:recombinase family protein n=1 Tax=Thiomicrorhabdus sp. TaxID=2039724 RepID=UPI0029C8A035|nr:recombinase family protein [Thiomicrorhabdus sp.]
MALIGYARVSTIEQDLELQLESLTREGCEEIFSGKQSGISQQNESKLNEMLNYIRNGDVVVVTKLDRLGRSLKSILATVDRIHQKGASLKTLDGAIDSTDNSPFAKAMVSLLGVFAELERDLIVQRTTEGRERAQKAGKHMGRPQQISDKDRKLIRQLVASKAKSMNSLSKEYGVSRTTIRRICDEEK